jgi:hypothetical protein
VWTCCWRSKSRRFGQNSVREWRGQETRTRKRATLGLAMAAQSRVSGSLDAGMSGIAVPHGLIVRYWIARPARAMATRCSAKSLRSREQHV